jgi:DNA polymerase/3'-5' exonuclease PolX
MSIGRPVRLARALEIAQQISELLAPVVARSKVAGSVRRQRPVVSDLEFVIEPRRLPGDLFGNEGPNDIASIRALAESWGRIKRGGERLIGVQNALDTGLDVELYLVHPPARWAVILAIRTGPAELGQWAVTRMRKYGRRCEGGRILDMRTGEELPCETEEAFFEYAKLQFLPPRFRDSAGARAPMEHVNG